jgi:hypothetical protein
MDEQEARAWARASEGDEDELGRLADLAGCEGLRRGGIDHPKLRVTALLAMANCRDFSELPFLADVAAGPSEPEALAALASITSQAARRRRATDPDDARELDDGCRALLALARSGQMSRQRRVGAVDALRMLADRGCVRRDEIPVDLDTK